MKLKTFLTVSCVCLLQIIIYSQTQSLVNNLEVQYKPLAHTSITNPSLDIKCTPEARITMLNTDSVSKIYFKMKNQFTEELIYEVNYNFSTSNITSETGETLYSRDGNAVYIGVPIQVTLQPYRCEIFTEDLNGKVSEVFTKIQ